MAPWPCPTAGGGTAGEHAFAIDRGRARRLLVIPALFDEGNRLRRFTVETMRALDRIGDGGGVDSILIDLPGCNESLAPLETADVALWRSAVVAAARHFGASHVLALRAGAVLLADELAPLPAMALAPIAGASVLRQMVRMRVLSSREAGREETGAALMDMARTEGIVLAGYPLCAAMVRGLENAEPGDAVRVETGGPGLWLRAEAADDAAQSAHLANAIAAVCAG
jgi:hypothetical protein